MSAVDEPSLRSVALRRVRSRLDHHLFCCAPSVVRDPRFSFSPEAGVLRSGSLAGFVFLLCGLETACDFDPLALGFYQEVSGERSL